MPLEVSPKWRGLLENAEPAREMAGGGGSAEGLGPLPSADQVAVACWPEIPSSVTEQVLDPLSLALLGGSGSIFSGSPGDAFPTEANSKPGLFLLSQRSWGLVSLSLINLNGTAGGWPFSGGGVSNASACLPT